MPAVNANVRIDELEERIEALEKKLPADITALRAEFQKADSEQKAALESRILDGDEQNSQETRDAESRITPKIDELGKDMGARVEKLDGTLRKSLTELEKKLEQMIKDGDQAVTTTTIALGERLAADAERGIQECREQFLVEIEELKKRIQDAADSFKGPIQQLTEALSKSTKDAEDNLDAATIKHEHMMEDLSSRIDHEAEHSREERDKIKKALLDKLESTRDGLIEYVDGALKRQETQTLGQLAAMSQDVGNQITDIKNQVKGAQNTHTRAVTWTITNFRNKLQQLISSKSQSLWSPDFSLCATPLMALQLQVSAPANDNPTPTAPSFRNKVLPIPGMCSLHLWGEPGMKVTFRVALGEGGHNSKRFEYNFEAAPGEPKAEEETKELPKRSSFFMPNLNTIDRVWNEQEDTLTVCFEMLDLKYLVPQLHKVAPQEASLPDASREEVSNLGATEKLVLHRNVAADTLMFDKCNRELQVVKNRAVRRVEWQLDGCISLLQFSNVGESVDSAVFTAAGLERVQLHFYPKGLNSDSLGNCSLFISCGRNTYLRCQLSVGKQSRAVEHFFERSGEVYGKGRFGAMDAEMLGDRLLIAMDIHEAHVEHVDKGKLRAGDGRGDGLVTSVLRLKKAGQSDVDELLKCASLPTIGMGGNAAKKMQRNPSNGQMAKTNGFLG